MHPSQKLLNPDDLRRPTLSLCSAYITTKTTTSYVRCNHRLSSCPLLILYGLFSRSVDGRHEHAAGKLIINVLWRCHGIYLRTQIGFSIGGIARRFLVQPPSMSKSGFIFCCSTFRCDDHESQSGLPNSLPARCSTPFTNRPMQAWVIAEA